MNVKIKSVVVYLSLFIIISLAAFAAPNPPSTISNLGSERKTDGSTGTTVAAQAGNVTELLISGVATTQSWQGYFGNISGNIVLDNAADQSFYRWELVSPQGEVYASNQSSVNWSSVVCVNMTGNGSANREGINATQLNAMFGIDETDADTFQRTFNETFSGTFYVGNRANASTNVCPATRLYDGTLGRTVNWQEVLMTDNGTESIIFASIINNNQNGFDNETRDFQMLVAENGHNGDTSPMNYFFFVELE